MKNKEHLKGLDSLRAIAALIVVWSHIEFIKGLKNIPQNNFIFFPNAHFSVTLFFVLSGFLITFLLVKEFQKYQTISFKNFYIRRILRIWPLYYLIILISYFFTEHQISNRTLLLCISIFPNIPPALKSSWEGSPQIWSIGVEEQFYIFWPIFILYVLSKKKQNSYILTFIIIYTLLPFIINYINISTIQNEKLYSFVEKFFYYTKFNCMAIGAFLGFNLASNKTGLSIYILIPSLLLLCLFRLFLFGFVGLALVFLLKKFMLYYLVL